MYPAANLVAAIKRIAQRRKHLMSSRFVIVKDLGSLPVKQDRVRSVENVVLAWRPESPEVFSIFVGGSDRLISTEVEYKAPLETLRQVAAGETAAWDIGRTVHVYKIQSRPVIEIELYRGQKVVLSVCGVEISLAVAFYAEIAEYRLSSPSS